MAERIFQVRPSDPVAASASWVRPADWLALPMLSAGDQKLVGLYAVFNHDSNFVALTCAGAVTVDWGDGSAPEDVAADVQANHAFTWASVSGSTLTSGGCRQAIITVTPQAGQSLTSVSLNAKHTSLGAAAGVTTGWLDIAMAGAAVSTLAISASGFVVRHAYLQQFTYVGTSAIITTANLFLSCPQLGSVVGPSWTANVTTFTSMFQSCTALQAAPMLDTSAGTSFGNMFQTCTALQSVPLLNTAAGTTFTNMFNACRVLRTVPLLDTSAGLDFGGMFQNCAVLRTVPLLNTAAGTGFATMFDTCSALQSVPLLDTGAGTSFFAMFSSCGALQSVPLLNTGSGTNFTNVFAGCTSLSVGALAGTAKSISYANCKLSAAELNRIYSNLGATTAQTVTVTGNWGIGTDNPALVPSGWTVTGS
jgi:hypothetical protein